MCPFFFIMVLIVQQVAIEGPETIGTFFKRHGYAISIIKLYANESIPNDLSGIEAVICLGGPMNVYEEEKYPFLKDENVFIQKVTAKKIPYLGICLGSQLLAKSCDAAVIPSPQKEIGFSSIRLTEAGRNDPLFHGMDGVMDVYQWHEDMFTVPAEGRLLAESDVCPAQAFKVGHNAYGLQFHVEITDKSIRAWADKYFKDASEREEKKSRMLKDYYTRQSEFEATAEKMYTNFLEIVRTKKLISSPK